MDLEGLAPPAELADRLLGGLQVGLGARGRHLVLPDELPPLAHVVLLHLELPTLVALFVREFDELAK